MTIKTGTEEDHALLMASIFRTVKHEDQVEFRKFAKEMKDKTFTKKDKDKAMLTVEVKDRGKKEEGGDDEEEKGDKEGDEIAPGSTPTKTPEPTGGIGGLGGGLGGLGGKKEDEEFV